MEMRDYINDFTNHLSDAINIGEKSSFSNTKKNINSVLICGLGGSGIGGAIVADILSKKIAIPILLNKDYDIPNHLGKDTLVIINSYSGNTEETLSALELCYKRQANIAIITSGGKLRDFALNQQINNIIVPAGHPPRAMFGYAFVEIFYTLHHYNLINDDFKYDLRNAIKLLDEKKETIKQSAKSLAKNLHKTTPIIYVASGFEGVAVRFRQQINENSKMLCWHHVIPEMNHNELLGWRTNIESLSVVFFRNNCDHQRNQIRMNISRKVISKYTENITEIWSKGDSLIENSLYHINLGDWTSWYLSEQNNVDAIEIDVINYLKEKLADVDE
jgi:glucose/mannose-6-phosphate isomerase